MAKWSLLSLVSSIAASVASVTVQVSDVKYIPLNVDRAATSADDLFRRSCPEEITDNNSWNPPLPYKPDLLLSSFPTGSSSDASVFASSGSLVRGAVEAWAQHQHLVLRPEEIWFEILAQLNMYMAAHADDLGHLFVSHDDKERVVVGGYNWEDIIASFGGEVQKRVKTDWLLDWVMPGFSTSTKNDEITATVLMMGLMQYYFDFEGIIVCGIPSVTLLGERTDWAKLLSKLDHLKDFGKQPALFAENLRPILSRFVRTWDDPESEGVKAFWDQIVRANKHWSCGEGAVEWSISGWITGFSHFTRNGRPRIAGERVGSVELDGVVYVSEALEDIGAGYAKVPFFMRNSQGDTMSYLLAGNVGVERKDTDGRVTARPLSGWFLYGPVDVNVTVGPQFGSRDELEGVAEGLLSRCEKP